ncbi:MAG TPA: acyl carrier protein [Thermotogota bacterium]|nr:acyl carrier protein [Thermotogota bacterium]HPJ88989.1 acyl carrier protein [Thermotogota bacterium]HPR95500.1 acyl carrier protein [Thermotogota bacterium]
MMTREEIFKKVQETLVENLDLEESDITEDAVLSDDLDATSLELVDLVMDLEKQLKTRIELEELTELETVGDVVDLIEKKVKEKEVPESRNIEKEEE